MEDIECSAFVWQEETVKARTGSVRPADIGDMVPFATSEKKSDRDISSAK